MINQRRLFSDTLQEEMRVNDKIVLLVGDLGYRVFDNIIEEFPDRFYNTGAAEQLMVNMAVGLSLSGYRPVCYSITPFLLWRAAEQIRLYIDHENIPVVLVGSGRGDDYANQGFSHDASDDVNLMRGWINIEPYWPNEDKELVSVTKLSLVDKHPYYINLSR